MFIMMQKDVLRLVLHVNHSCRRKKKGEKKERSHRESLPDDKHICIRREGGGEKKKGGLDLNSKIGRSERFFSPLGVLGGGGGGERELPCSSGLE